MKILKFIGTDCDLTDKISNSFSMQLFCWNQKVWKFCSVASFLKSMCVHATQIFFMILNNGLYLIDCSEEMLVWVFKWVFFTFNALRG